MITHPVERLHSITQEHVAALSAGATLLGSGGGGQVDLGALVLCQALQGREVEVRSVDDLPDEAWVVHLAVFGAPDVMAEKLLSPTDLAVAARAVLDQLDVPLAAVGILEIGGLNTHAALVAAASLGAPVIDGDLMGRAFPSITKTTMAVAGEPVAPMAVVGPAGDVAVIPHCSDRMAERLLVGCNAAMGGAVSVALFPTTAATLRTVGIAGTLSTCVALGRRFLAAPPRDPQALADALGGHLLFEGRVEEVRPRSTTTAGSVTLAEGPTIGTIARVDLTEEFLAVAVDGHTVACTPDIVVALNPIDGSILAVDQIRLGQPVTLISLPAMHRWPTGAEWVVGAEAFGLEPVTSALGGPR